MFSGSGRLTFFYFLFLYSTVARGTKLQEEQISRWSNKIGTELWRLGETTTRFKEIQGSYIYFNAQVETKDLENLLKEVVKDIETMMDRKSDAIKCIQEEAERAAESFVYNGSIYEYYSSKYSNIFNATKIELPESLEKNKNMYLYLNNLNMDTHFYNLPVDTNLSAVHVPMNIHDRHKEAASVIQWSEALNEVFRKNYNADPALSWQYFGSSTGIMRLYPAKRWQYDYTEDVFDCRTRTWYIEATTCTKDIVILVDNSGSMDGMGKHIAKLAVLTTLATFSNNDYVNVLFYQNETTFYTIPCFEDMLVQATPGNIALFKESVESIPKPMGKADVTHALQVAFEILEKKRHEFGCVDITDFDFDPANASASTCNQAIMVITDGVIRNVSDIVLKNNYRNGVRLFSYLIGKEVTNVEDLKWMACANRGYYTQVQTLEQVNSAILQYINVVARPLVLQAKDHPTSWTHAYVDPSYDDTLDDQINEPYRLVTSAAVPAFDRRVNEEKNKANLLGVAGTDVPISDIERLTSPYKLGVNAYAFIISNNGYVLMHRDLRPMFEGKLRHNYNSIDLVELEHFDNELPERVFSPDLLNLRNSIVNGSSGKIFGIPVKYHYDDMKRVTKDKYDYYYAPIEETPFSLAFAVPDGYGHFSLLVDGDDRDEITNDRHKPGARITEYFVGQNWKIHPKWVYCKYHYLEGHEFETPEKEIIHFLERVYRDDFKWEKQYETSGEEKLTEVVCGRKTHDNNDYYCDRQLVERLVFDAKNTFSAFQSTTWKGDSEMLLRRFNVTLRFVATMSGLTRWEYISEEVENNTEKEFGDLHSKGIDETWYNSAIIQRRYDPESFVYSVPFKFEDPNEILVTASYAIFLNKSAPGCVVGYQFARKNLAEIVDNITSVLSIECVDCGTCQTNLMCYIIDDNGYIVLSGEVEQTGRFFGQIEKDIMASMVEKRIFENATIYDYQAICYYLKDVDGAANSLYSFVDTFRYFFHWSFVKMSWFLLEWNVWSLWPSFGAAEDIVIGSDGKPKQKVYYDCDKKRVLYMLQQKRFLNDYPVEIQTSNPLLNYYIKKIPHSNLLFVAVNETAPRNKGDLNSEDVTEAQEIVYDTDYSCQKKELNRLSRRKLKGCYNEHPREETLQDACGSSSRIRISYISSFLAFLANLYIVM